MIKILVVINVIQIDKKSMNYVFVRIVTFLITNNTFHKICITKMKPQKNAKVILFLNNRMWGTVLIM